MYVESSRHACLIHLANSTVVRTYSKLGDITRNLPGRGFVRCHNSYIISISYVDAFTPDGFVMADGASIPISRRYRQDSKDAFCLLASARDV